MAAVWSELAAAAPSSCSVEALGRPAAPGSSPRSAIDWTYADVGGLVRRLERRQHEGPDDPDQQGGGEQEQQRRRRAALRHPGPPASRWRSASRRPSSTWRAARVPGRVAHEGEPGLGAPRPELPVVEQRLERVGERERVGRRELDRRRRVPNSASALPPARSTQGSPQAIISCGISE